MKKLKRSIIQLLKSSNLFWLYLWIRTNLHLESKQEKELAGRLFNFYSQFIKKGDLIYDVGANLGNRVRIFTQLGAKVIAIEPQRQLARYLKFSFSKNVQVLQCAVGAKNGFQPIYNSNVHTVTTLSKEFSHLKSGQNANIRYTASQVEVKTLDSITEKYGVPDFCKIDVEGFEYEVLLGLTRKIKKMSIEFNTPEFNDLTIQCLEYLERLGDYECNYSFKESLKMESPQWIVPSEMIAIIRENFNHSLQDYGDIYINFL